MNAPVPAHILRFKEFYKHVKFLNNNNHIIIILNIIFNTLNIPYKALLPSHTEELKLFM
jgi:hypothetical protein